MNKYAKPITKHLATAISTKFFLLFAHLFITKQKYQITKLLHLRVEKPVTITSKEKARKIALEISNNKEVSKCRT